MTTYKTHHIVPDASPPPPSSLYSHAVEVAGWLYVTGQLPTDPDAPAVALAEGIEEQAAFCFENLGRILRHADYTYEDAVFVRIYLSEFDRDFARFNTIYARYFPQGNARLPARTTIGVDRLGRSALVEIDLVCYKQP